MVYITLIILISLFFHYLALVSLTFNKFKDKGYNISLITSFVIPLLLIKIHLLLVKEEWNKDRGYAKFILKIIFLSYNLPLVILVEFVNLKIETKEISLAPKEKVSVIKKILASMQNLNQFEDALSISYA